MGTLVRKKFKAKKSFKKPEKVGEMQFERLIRNSMILNGSVEVKIYDNSFSAAGNSLTWTSCRVTPTSGTTMFCPSQGTTLGTRVGNKVKVLRIEASGGWIWNPQESNSSALPGGLQMRVLFLRDTQTSGANYSSATLMNSVGPTLHQFIAPQWLRKFVVEQDDYVTFDATIAANQYPTNLDKFYYSVSSYHYSWVFDYSGGEKSLGQPVEVEFASPQGTAFAVENILTNSWSICANALLDEVVYTLGSLTHRGNFRFYYVDAV